MTDKLKQGLTLAEVAERQAQYGKNTLPEKKGDGALLIFARQFASPFVYVLIAAALVSFALGQNLNGIFIGLVLCINATIGTIQEYSAQQAAAALRKMVPQHASVIREGVVSTIDAEELVPGDIVQLVSGDKVPADMHLLQAQELLINESILTGESEAAIKQAGGEPDPSILKHNGAGEHAPLSEQTNLGFAGTIVTHGRALGEVIAIGPQSQIGLIATAVSVGEKTKSPLLERIERFTKMISIAVLVIIAVLFIISVARGEDLTTVFLLGVALAVSAIPEGLPAAITVALAIGMRRMAKVNVIVRKLIAVESLGSCTYICSDKTGTLTVNEMTIRKVILPDGTSFDVSGEGLDTHGEILMNSAGSEYHQAVEDMVLAGMLANESSLKLKHSGDSTEWVASGDGVDLAFLVLAEKFGIDQQHAATVYPELCRIPYESENAFSASLNRVGSEQRIFVKGSTERILSMCTNTAKGVNPPLATIEKAMSDLAEQGYRVLAVATNAEPVAQEQAISLTSIADKADFKFLGLVGMIDPLRPEAKDAIRECRTANIEVAMITGDHPQTALSIAKELEIAGPESVVVSGKQLAEAQAKSKQDFAELVHSSHVFARVEPVQKLEIVKQLIDDGHYVAVTGDGVNDAPALRHAHVGISMGKRGTDVARESSELILTDDKFSSIVQGIKQGRIVYNNIRKVVFLLISTGAAEITLFILSVLFGYPIPLFPIQLLWLNLVTNGIQDVALAFEPEEGDELKRPPRPPSETLFNRLMIERVLTNAIVMGFLAFGVFVYCLHMGMEEHVARNITLLLMVLFENVHVLNSRSETLSIFKQPFFGNPFLLFGMLAAQSIHIIAMYTPGLSDILDIHPVTFNEWLTLLGIALILVLVDESHKVWHKRRSEK